MNTCYLINDVNSVSSTGMVVKGYWTKTTLGWYSNAYNSDKLSLVEIYLTKVYPVGGHSVFPKRRSCNLRQLHKIIHS